MRCFICDRSPFAADMEAGANCRVCALRSIVKTWRSAHHDKAALVIFLAPPASSDSFRTTQANGTIDKLTYNLGPSQLSAEDQVQEAVAKIND
jgi:hypothetical protein